MNYLIYGRVSTSRQAERELSIPAQVKACQKYGMDHHWNLAPDGVYEEKGESARTTVRPQLQKMLHRAKTDPKVDAILMHKLDRMCRNVADYAAIKMMLKKHDVRLISVVEQFDESFSGELVENIMSSIAQWTSQNISWEVKKGLREAVERGRFPGYAPTGYLNDKKTKSLIVDNLRAPFVKMAFERYATGKYSYDSLAAYLAERGFKSKYGNLVRRTSIEHILANPIYYGLVKTRSATCQANFPKLITKKLFDDVQEIIQQHNHAADRSRKHSYPMSGFMRCAVCGSTLCGQMQKGHLYYSCTHWNDRKCTERKYIRWELIEQQVENHLSRIQLPDRFKRVLDEYIEHFATERLGQEEKERKSLKQELVRVQQQIRNIVVDRSKRIMDAEVFIKIQDELLREKEMYQDRLRVLEGKSDKFVQKFNEILEFADHADRVFQTSSMHQKRLVVKLCFDGFTVQNQKLTPIWTPVFDVLMDLNSSNFEPPKVVGKGSKDSKTLAVTKVQSCQSGGGGEIWTHDTVARMPVFETGAFNHSATPPSLPKLPDFKRFVNCQNGPKAIS